MQIFNGFELVREQVLTEFNSSGAIVSPRQNGRRVAIARQ